jgi:hypothetical protein
LIKVQEKRYRKKTDPEKIPITSETLMGFPPRRLMVSPECDNPDKVARIHRLK